MSLEEIRSVISIALEDAEVGEGLTDSRLRAFEEGVADIVLEEIELDSLARLDLLVALEMEFGVVITPQAFLEFQSLVDVATYVAAAQEQGSAGASPQDPPARVSVPTLDENAPRVARVFHRALRHCRGAGEVSKLLQAFEHRLTPSEAAELLEWHEEGRLLPSDVPESFRLAADEWTARIGAMLARSGKPEPEAFVCHRIGPAAQHFEGPGDRAKKILLIGFSTREASSTPS